MCKYTITTYKCTHKHYARHPTTAICHEKPHEPEYSNSTHVKGANDCDACVLIKGETRPGLLKRVATRIRDRAVLIKDECDEYEKEYK
ncbi:uncharacterized protein LAJ45_07829 [Morchella importuna]|uniref:uncharacterized protein n=1 Tax=Morchella importuna TaxID=1174673 RepID=UPI001E8DE202|nr:uncharacterized protein LAJ45_07829 [Morchella importuna]KAH8148065.1 hypothetical protein LAJ45_07829 [Morchella importuna]